MRKPILASIVIAGTLLALLFGVMFTLESRWFSDYLSGKLSEKFGQQVNWQGSLYINWSLSPTVQLEQLKIDNPEWALHERFATADKVTARIALPKLVQGVVAIQSLQIEQPHVHLTESAEFGSNWSLLSSGDSESQQKSMFTVKLQELVVDQGRITYTKPVDNTNLAASFNSHDSKKLRIRGEGQFKGEQVQLSINADPLKEVIARSVDEVKPPPEETYAIIGHLKWNKHTLSVDGTTGSLSNLNQLQFTLDLAGPDAQALAQLAVTNAYQAPYQLQAQVSRTKNTWSFTDITGEMGETRLHGEASYDTGGERSAVDADLDISSIDLPRLFGGIDADPAKGDADSAAADDESGNVQGVANALQQWLVPLREYDAQVTLDIGQLQQKHILVRELHTEFTLNKFTLTIDALRFKTGGGQVNAEANIKTTCEIKTSDIDAEHCGKNEIGIRGKVDIQVEAVNLGEALAHNTNNELGTLAGDFHAQLDDQALLITESRLHYRDDESATDVVAKITQRKTASGAAGVQIKGDGKLSASPLSFEISAGPLLDLGSKTKPYPLEARVTYEATIIEANGTLTQPLQISNADLQVQAEGPNPAQLNQLLRTNLPNMPSYDVSGHFLRKENAWYLRDVRAEVGASDLSGNLRWEKGDDKRFMVKADFTSLHLDLDALTGNQPKERSQTDGTTTQQQADDNLIPSEDLPKQILQSFDAQITYDAKRVTSKEIPLDSINTDLTLNGGELTLAPLMFGVADGAIELNLNADALPAPMNGQVKLDINRLHLNRLLAPFDVADDSSGLIGGRGEFDFTGDSLAQALANLQGQMHLIMNGGRLDGALVEALGLDAGELLMGLLGDELNSDKVQCAYAKLKANDGIIDLAAFTVATSDSNILGGGTANLEKETFDLTFEAKPKDVSVLSGSSPIQIHGSFSNPKVDAISDDLAKSGALAAIGAAIFPPAALLPLVEWGETEGVNGCEQAIDAAKSVAAQ